MPYNHALEYRKFEAQQRRLRREYEQAGMREAEISAMYLFDLAVFNRERRHWEHTRELPEDFRSLADPADEAHPRLWWVEEIGDPVLAKRLKALSETDLELLTLYAMDGYTQPEIARKQGTTQQAISKKLARLKNFLK